jgi:hypothetical protein
LRNDLPNRDTIERAEDLILRLRDIHSCRISTDETGGISEVHVVAATERSPKMIARDVETCLKAELGLAVDYRKIGVVIIDPMKETDPERLQDASREGIAATAGVDTDRIIEERMSEVSGDASVATGARSAGTEGGEVRREAVEREAADRGKMPAETAAPRAFEPAGQLEFLEEDARMRFAGLHLEIEESRMEAEVRLAKNGLEVVGCLGGIRTSGPAYATIAGATIHALTELLDEDFHICLSSIQEIDLSGRKALLAVVDVVEGRSARSYAGCVFLGRDSNEAAVLAVLDALNRPIGKWKSRKEIHYRIT